MPPRGKSGPGKDDDDEDDDEEIGEYVVEGKELKRALKRGRRRTVPFAFCPVAGDETTWFATHKKKNAARIARRTRRESGQSKVAFGTFVVEGRLLILTCIDLLPNLAKRVKKHLARENIRMNVRAFDADGVEFDSEIEDLGTEDILADVEDDDEAGDANAPPRDRFARRVEALQDAVLSARGEAGDRLRHLLLGALDAQDKGDDLGAGTLLDRLETHVRQLMRSAARPAVSGTPKPAPQDKAPALDRSQQLKLARSVKALRQRIDALNNEAEDRLMKALAIGARQVKGGDLIGASDTIGKVSDALERVEARKKPEED